MKTTLNPFENAKRTAQGTGGVSTSVIEEIQAEILVLGSQNETQAQDISDIKAQLTELAVAYSTTEQKTGRKDIDGKDIYSKSFTVDALPNATDAGFNHGISNIHRLVKLYGAAQNSDKTTYYPLPYVAQENFVGCIKLSMNATQISIWAGSDRSNLSAIVTVEYTKTGA